MVYCIIILILFLILLLVSGYLVLKFFSKIAGINMFSAMACAFDGNKSDRLLFYFLICIYILTFAIFFVFLFFLPKRVVDMNTYHAGGLLGYSIGQQTRIYDHSEQGYIDYPMLFAPSSADKFTEAFEVVIIYKQPSDTYYQTTELLGLCFNISWLVAGVIFLGIVYLMLYSLAEDYIKRNNVKKKLSHRFMATRFRKIVRMAPWQALVIFLSVFILILGISAIYVYRLVTHYSTIYGSYQKTLRSELLQKVSPRDTLRGYVISRFQSQESETNNIKGADGKTHEETTYYHIFHYTVEFRDLIHVPVYLNMAIHENREEAKVLEEPFSDTNSAVPEYIKEYAFIVNPDYSISLMMDENK
jgi:hypothetical protein